MALEVLERTKKRRQGKERQYLLNWRFRCKICMWEEKLKYGCLPPALVC